METADFPKVQRPFEATGVSSYLNVERYFARSDHPVEALDQ